MSIKIMNAIWESNSTSGSDRLVLLALADNANDEGECWPSVATIARKANISKRYTQMILEKLLREGHILRQQRYDVAKHKNMTNVFTVVRPVSLVNPTSLPSEPYLTTPSEVGLGRVVRQASPKPPVNHHIEPPVIPTEATTENAFGVYERNIGPLTPMIAETITDAVKDYTDEWVRESIKEAVHNNVRKWNYAAAILKGWKENGYKIRIRKQAEPPVASESY